MRTGLPDMCSCHRARMVKASSGSLSLNDGTAAYSSSGGRTGRMSHGVGAPLPRRQGAVLVA